MGKFNQDAFADLAVANAGSDSVSILLGNDSGGFVSAADFSVGAEPSSVAVAEFNGNAFLDLARSTADFGVNSGVCRR